MGIGYDINSLYPFQMNMLKALEVWVYEFAWKPHRSQTSGNLIWLKQGYRRVGSDTWMDSTDYIMYRLSEE